jgi:hypothetical protein
MFSAVTLFAVAAWKEVDIVVADMNEVLIFL